MTSERQAESNRQNAQLSTGPRSAVGKAKVAQNAIKHGAYSMLPIIPGVERCEDWEAHQAGIMQSLAPVGALETRLAERVALLLWRLDRVARYETAVTTIGLDEVDDAPAPSDDDDDNPLSSILGRNPDPIKKATKDLKRDRTILAELDVALEGARRFPGMADGEALAYETAFRLWESAHNDLPENSKCPWVEDDDFFKALGMSESPAENDVAWTVGLVRRGLVLIAKYAKRPVEDVTALSIRGIEEHHAERRKDVKKSSAKLKALQERKRVRTERAKARSVLPGPEAEFRVLRFENHLSRQLFQTLHELERIRASRDGQPVPMPLAIDVGVSVSGDGVDANAG
jgi:hypothetical protein